MSSRRCPRTTLEGWASYSRVAWGPDCRTLLAVGPEDFTRASALGRFSMDNGLRVNLDGKNWSQLVKGTIVEGTKRLEVEWQPVPNTLRAVESAWSPDGQTIVFSRYGDGTHNLWSISPDGTNARRLTEFDDGTQVQGISFVPDGSGVLVSLFHAHQQDLWYLQLSDAKLFRLTNTPHVETDPKGRTRWARLVLLGR